jgi:serine/threonine protein kinase
VISIITRQLLLGLSHCHEIRGSIHRFHAATNQWLSSFCFRLTACRDIKPANVLVHSSGAIKISDFGMSKAHLKDVAASSVGTLYYMSPERCLSNDYSFNAGIMPGSFLFESS